MRHFTVEKEYLLGQVKRIEALQDGSCACANSYEVDGDNIAKRVVLGLLVNIYNEQGMLEYVDYYPVKSDTSVPPVCEDGMLTVANNIDEVMGEIKQKYPPEKYDNYNW